MKVIRIIITIIYIFIFIPFGFLYFGFSNGAFYEYVWEPTKSEAKTLVEDALPVSFPCEIDIKQIRYYLPTYQLNILKYHKFVLTICSDENKQSIMEELEKHLAENDGTFFIGNIDQSNQEIAFTLYNDAKDLKLANLVRKYGRRIHESTVMYLTILSLPVIFLWMPYYKIFQVMRRKLCVYQKL
ncbi:hypothetical protein ACTQ34_15895 [Agathobaculum sp. LCP25S3_E8]|uniref:hypothetical protein n=1 Tax=Agathobaculum sp. LCP25S3_E8 TaxID=3438735 RepID=UPI003F931FD4